MTERTDRSTRSVNTVLSSPASLPPRGGAGVSRHLSLSQHGTPVRGRRSDSLTGDSPSSGGGGGGGGGAASKELAQLRDGLRDRWAGLQPRLDHARWKAEAGLSRRGFVSHRGGSVFRREGEERLVDTDDDDDDDDGGGGDGGEGREGRGYGYGGGDGDGFGVDRGEDGDEEPPSVDRDYRGSDDERTGRTRGAGGASRPRAPWEAERDEMKWPVAPGEGWTPL